MSRGCLVRGSSAIDVSGRDRLARRVVRRADSAQQASRADDRRSPHRRLGGRRPLTTSGMRRTGRCCSTGRARGPWVTSRRRWSSRCSSPLAPPCGLRFEFFGYPAVELARPIDWNHDPVAKVRWPDVTSSRIDHRTAAGDVKWIWELNRLQHLPWLAQAWLFTDDDELQRGRARAARLMARSAAPGPGDRLARRLRGGSALDLGRNRATGTSGLTSADRPSDAATCVTMLAISAQRCWTDRSLFSSANNHLVGELAGAAHRGHLVPGTAGCSSLGARAVAALARRRSGRSCRTDRVPSRRSATRCSQPS